jgi:hypothetical protein
LKLNGFYPVSEFYNFIKQPGNTIIPQAMPTLVPLPGDTCNTFDRTNLFTPNNLYRMSLSTHSVALPKLVFKGTGAQNDLSIQTPYGHWEGLQNVDSFTDNFTLTIMFYELEDPVIENFIYPWHLACLYPGDNGYSYPFPRLNIAIKLYKPTYFNQSAASNGKLTVYPSVIYWVTGLFPSNIELMHVTHEAGDATGVTRQVVFSFNRLLVLPNAAFAQRYKLEHLFSPITLMVPQPTKEMEILTITKTSKTSKTSTTSAVQNIASSIKIDSSMSNGASLLKELGGAVGMDAVKDTGKNLLQAGRSFKKSHQMVVLLPAPGQMINIFNREY